jgi:hypothetical protein
LLELSSLMLCKCTHPSFDRIKKPIKAPTILKLTNVLSYLIYFSIHFCRSELFHFHCRHAEFISVSGLWVVKVEILKQVQDDGIWGHTEFIQVTTLIVLNYFISILVVLNYFILHSRRSELFHFTLSSCWIISFYTLVMLNLFQYLVLELLRSRSWNKFRMTEFGVRRNIKWTLTLIY